MTVQELSHIGPLDGTEGVESIDMKLLSHREKALSTSWLFGRKLLVRTLIVAALLIVFDSRSQLVVVAQEIRETQGKPFSENVPRRARRTEPLQPAETLRSARFIYVRSASLLVTAEDIENKLRKHPDFQRYGLFITRQEADADLILEVRRSVLTKFVFTAIDPRTLIVVASGKLSSLGGTVDGKVSKLFMKQLVAARQ